MFNQDYVITGKHAHYVKFLNAYQRNLDKDKYGKNAGIFPLAVDVYMVAPLVGATYNRYVPVDNETSDSTRIFAEAIIRRQKQLDTVYRLVMLSERSSTLTDDERVTRAFRDDEAPEKLAANLDLFHQYMRGGVEWLYEQATEDATTQEDFFKRIMELVNQFSEDFDFSEMDSDFFE
jgi:hypothetical protein